MDSYLPRHPSQEKAKVTVASYVKNLGKNILEGHGLSFHGAVGTGKTHLAASVISAALGRQISTYFVTEDGLFSKLRAEWDDHEAEARFVSLLQCVRILVIDDMGTRKPSDYVAEKYENIINERYNKSMPTIITTNHTPEELLGVYPRQMSRLAGNAVVVVGGPDGRILA